MRDKDRIVPYMVRLTEVWKRHPELRLTQLILNVEENNPFLYYKEDEDFIGSIEEYYKKLEEGNK